MELRGGMRGKVVRSTVSDSKAPCPLDRVSRQFRAERPDPTGQGRPKESVELATPEWVSWFSHHRLLEPIGYMPSAEAEANYYRHLASQPGAESAALT